ncbi:MAG: peptidylprolyl isomerase [Acidobacteriaceae bacterium]
MIEKITIRLSIPPATMLLRAFGLLCVVCAAPVVVSAQVSTSSSGKAAPQEDQPLATLPKSQGVLLDRVVAIVNGDLVLESDVEEEMRLAAFVPGAVNTRQHAIDRLIDRTLIEQQERLQPPKPVTEKEVQDDLNELRKHIPACARYKCDTEQGWQQFLISRGFTEKELNRLWKQRMELLRFIEMRFRAGLHISQTEIDEYYQKTMLPEYAREKVKPPSEESIAPRIEGVLLQQHVNQMLDAWLKSLRAQGNVRVLRGMEDAP